MTPQVLIESTPDLPALPEVYMRAREVADCQSADINKLGEVIATDPSLTARLLQVVNSPFYGFPARVESVSRAITLIGTEELMQLVLATSVIRVFEGIPAHLMNMRQFWLHSISVGHMARLLAEHQGHNASERFFVMGLLHDVGELVMLMGVPAQQRDVLQRQFESGVVQVAIEHEIFGFDHAEAGATLMADWGLPLSLQTTCRWHHQPEKAEVYLEEAGLVATAEKLVTNLELQDAGADPVDMEIIEGLPGEDQAELIGTARDSQAEIFRTFFPG